MTWYCWLADKGVGAVIVIVPVVTRHVGCSVTVAVGARGIAFIVKSVAIDGFAVHAVLSSVTIKIVRVVRPKFGIRVEGTIKDPSPEVIEAFADMLVAVFVPESE